MRHICIQQLPEAGVKCSGAFSAFSTIPEKKENSLLTKRYRRCILTVLIQIVQFGADPRSAPVSEVRELISVNYRDPRPIYEQIRDELRKLILTGVIPPGDKLPSVRELAQ